MGAIDIMEQDAVLAKVAACLALSLHGPRVLITTSATSLCLLLGRFLPRSVSILSYLCRGLRIRQGSTQALPNGTVAKLHGIVIAGQ